MAMNVSCLLRPLFVLLLLAPAAPAQTAAPTYVPTFTFDVASVRESPRADMYMVRMTNPSHSSSFTATNFDVGNLLYAAFGIPRYKIKGVPDCCLRTMFNVQAKSDAATDDRLAKLSDEDALLEKRHMVLALLADRMKLTYHWEDRELPAQALVVQKSGSKLHEGQPLPLDPEKPWMSRPLRQQGDGVRGYEFIAHGASMNDLAGMLGSQFGQDVFDRTGLAGLYTFTLQYRGTEEDDTNTDPKIWPPIPRALREQLGLAVEPIKAPVHVLVIDHMEKPSDN
jgi:uncharacterized protein (TIGR03435 family)